MKVFDPAPERAGEMTQLLLDGETLIIDQGVMNAMNLGNVGYFDQLASILKRDGLLELNFQETSEFTTRVWISGYPNHWWRDETPAAWEYR